MYLHLRFALFVSSLAAHLGLPVGRGARRFLVGAMAFLGLTVVSLHAQSTYATPYAFTTLAGNGTSGSAHGTGADARFSLPAGVAVDTSGNNIYVADTSNNTIRKITSDGVVTTLAGTAGIAGSTDDTGAAARFNTPLGVA